MCIRDSYIAQQSGLVVACQVGDFSSDFPCCRQTTSRDAINEKLDALVKFEIANLRAYEIVLIDHETAIRALADYSGQSAEYVEAVSYTHLLIHGIEHCLGLADL